MRRAAIRLAAPLLKKVPSKQTCPTQTERISRDIYTKMFSTGALLGIVRNDNSLTVYDIFLVSSCTSGC